MSCCCRTDSFLSQLLILSRAWKREATAEGLLPSAMFALDISDIFTVSIVTFSQRTSVVSPSQTVAGKYYLKK